MNIDQALHIAVKYSRSGKFHKAEQICREILETQPDNADVLHFLGIVHYQLGNHDSAIDYIRKALHVNPHIADAYYNLGNALHDKGNLDDAIACYQKALQIDPQFAPAYNNLGNAFHDKSDLDAAISSYQKAINLNPSYVEAYFSLGNIHRTKGHPDHAITCYQKTLRLKPDFAEAYNNMGVAFMDKDNSDKAVSFFQKALSLKPSFGEAYCNLFYEFQQTCTWRTLEALTAQLNGLTLTALNTGAKPAESPFLAITRSDDSSLNLSIAQSWSNAIEKDMSHLNISFSFDDRRMDKTKIIIGYLSNEFRDHATAHLMLSLFGLHDRNNFQVFCYSYGKEDRSFYHERIYRDCDKFIDINAFSYDAAAKRIYEDQVDILVDLKGYSRDCRIAICALRPAPVQVGYLGFPGTTGADFIDYIITDGIVTPEDHAPYYSEKFVYLPHCYQVNDHTQPISDKVWEKKDSGLPGNSLVFSSFNHSYKIDPLMFDVWMRILRQVPESVLWLLFTNKTAEENLRREAEARGVKSERLIFAGRLPKDEHLSRLRLVDLALDTSIVNGHTTTSDALWAGVPVITLQGGHFASRVSASVLSAVRLPELITNSVGEYEALAVQLARSPAQLRAIRQRLAKNRLTEPLFDTPRFVRNLETAYNKMWNIFQLGEAPRQITVLEQGI